MSPIPVAAVKAENQKRGILLKWKAYLEIKGYFWNFLKRDWIVFEAPV